MSTAPATEKTTVFVLRYAFHSKMGGYVPVESDGRTYYLYKSVSRDKRHGYMHWGITEDASQARQWKTREGAEGWLKNNVDYPSLADANGTTSSFVVEEVQV